MSTVQDLSLQLCLAARAGLSNGQPGSCPGPRRPTLLLSFSAINYWIEMNLQPFNLHYKTTWTEKSKYFRTGTIITCTKNNLEQTFNDKVCVMSPYKHWNEWLRTTVKCLKNLRHFGLYLAACRLQTNLSLWKFTSYFISKIFNKFISYFITSYI